MKTVTIAIRVDRYDTIIDVYDESFMEEEIMENLKSKFDADVISSIHLVQYYIQTKVNDSLKLLQLQPKDVVDYYATEIILGSPLFMIDTDSDKKTTIQKIAVHATLSNEFLLDLQSNGITEPIELIPYIKEQAIQSFIGVMKSLHNKQPFDTVFIHNIDFQYDKVQFGNSLLAYHLIPPYIFLF